MKHTRELNKTLLHYHTCYGLPKQEMHQQAAIDTLHLAVEVRASSSSVISRSVRKLFDPTTYTSECQERRSRDKVAHENETMYSVIVRRADT